MTVASRGTASGTVPLTQIKRRAQYEFGWVNVGFGKRWTGSQWVQFWPAGAGSANLAFNLDESPDNSGLTLNLTKAPQT